MELHNAHVVAGLQRHRIWHDESLEAEHWFSLQDVPPASAAMLLCGFNPNEISLNDAKRITSTQTEPRCLVQLEQRFADLSTSKPRTRTLMDWFVAARDSQLKHASWIDRYVEAVPELAARRTQLAYQDALSMSAPEPPTEPESVVEAEQAPAGSVWPLQEPMRYQGYARPLYLVLKAAHAAGKSCPKPRDVLDAFRDTRPPELINVQHDGITYYDSKGNSKAADLAAISEAIRRMTTGNTR